jgi:1,4-dihydroxy-2-naphthoyl-CoA synthase
MKQLTEKGLAGDLDAGIELEITAAPEALMSDNVSEGLNAFQEKREPVFK